MATVADLIACVIVEGKDPRNVRSKADALRALGFDDGTYTHKKMLQCVLESHRVDGLTIKDMTAIIWRIAQQTHTREEIHRIAAGVARRRIAAGVTKKSPTRAAVIDELASALESFRL